MLNGAVGFRFHSVAVAMGGGLGVLGFGLGLGPCCFGFGVLFGVALGHAAAIRAVALHEAVAGKGGVKVIERPAEGGAAVVIVSRLRLAETFERSAHEVLIVAAAVRKAAFGKLVVLGERLLVGLFVLERIGERLDYRHPGGIARF